MTPQGENTDRKRDGHLVCGLTEAWKHEDQTTGISTTRMDSDDLTGAVSSS